MIYKFSFLVLLSIIWINLSSCDESLTPKDFDAALPYIQHLEVTPSQFDFNANADGQKDTTITLNLTVNGFNFEADSVPYYSIFIGDEELPSIQGSFQNSRSNNFYDSAVQIPTNTMEFNSYTVLVTPSIEEENQNYAQAVIKQTGISLNTPEILSVNNPEQVQIPPAGGTESVLFTAKVTDIDGQSNIGNVFLNFRNTNGSLLREKPFELLDNGSSSSGDVTATDSTFTVTFSINSSSTPSERTALYWALDKSGLSSDTLETTFNIVANE